MDRKPFTLPEAEPAMVRAVVVVLAFLASLGIGWAADVDSDTVTVWALVAGAVLPIAQGLWTRYGVTANAKVVARVTTEGTVVAGDAAVAPTGHELPLSSDDDPEDPPALYPVGVRSDRLAA